MSDLSIHHSMAHLQSLEGLERRVKAAAGSDRASPASSKPTSKFDSSSASHEQLLKAAKEFESIFMDIVTKSMRSTVQKSDVFGDSEKTDLFQSMLDTEYSKMSSGRQTSGIADAIVRQLESQGLSKNLMNREASTKSAIELKGDPS